MNGWPAGHKEPLTAMGNEESSLRRSLRLAPVELQACVLVVRGSARADPAHQTFGCMLLGSVSDLGADNTELRVIKNQLKY